MKKFLFPTFVVVLILGVGDVKARPTSAPKGSAVRPAARAPSPPKTTSAKPPATKPPSVPKSPPTNKRPEVSGPDLKLKCTPEEGCKVGGKVVAKNLPGGLTLTGEGSMPILPKPGRPDAKVCVEREITKNLRGELCGEMKDGKPGGSIGLTFGRKK